MTSDVTPRLNLPLIAAQQAQKHVTHNEAMRDLDALVQATVKDRDLAAPPASPQEGDCYIVAASATGAWAGQENTIAEFRNGGWVFHAPAAGWLVFVEDEAAFFFFDGTTWQSLTAAITATLKFLKLGVNTTADDTNRLAVKSDAVLFSHDDVTPGTGDVRFTINKKSAGNTASLLFQDNWSGRAEIGLAGDDNFSMNVSADGSAWNRAMQVEAATGAVDFPVSLKSSGSIVWSDGNFAARIDALDEDAAPNTNAFIPTSDGKKVKIANLQGGGIVSLNPVDGGKLGVNTTADDTNRVAVKSDAVLFSHDDVTPGTGDVRFTINKKSAGNTASLLFQDNWSGRAEIGLTGDDDFIFKVSSDGNTWDEAIRIDRNNGAVRAKRLLSGTIVIADNAVGLINTPYGGGIVAICVVHERWPQVTYSGIFAYDTGPSLFMESLALGGRIKNLGTATLTGTTGQDGYVSVAVKSGQIQIENRMGSTFTFSYTFIC